MMRRILVLFVSCVIIAGIAQAGRNLKNAKPAKLIVDDGIEREARGARGAYVPGLDDAALLNWVVVDSMANAFGPASTRTRPIAYDPATGVLAVLHRGAAPYALGSGQLWYNTSRDGGATWRRVGELNGGTPISCRYPSAGISNPANNSDTSQCLFLFMAPNLESAGTWGFYTYGVDFPLGGGAGTGFFDNTNLMGDNSAAGNIYGAYNSSSVIWCSTRGDLTGGPNDSRTWRTDDFVIISTQVPPTWTDAPPNFENAISFIPGMSNSTGVYFGMHGLFGGDTAAVAFNGGYSKSTNNGQTWSQWVRPQPDWMSGTGLPSRYDLYDYVQPPGGTVSYNSDMIIDGSGRGHFFHMVVDSPWTNVDARGILEAYETGTNTWAYKWVTRNLNEATGLGYPSTTSGTNYLQQTNNGVRSAISSDGQAIALVWLDAASTAPADTFPDIWFSWRRVNGTSWSTPTNLTQTPNFPELLLHAAPTMKSNGGNSYTMFIGRTYQTGINTYPPDNGVKSTFFVAPHTFTVTGVSEQGKPSTFGLAQNYPNPFNPLTNIDYSLAQQSHVTIKVYDLLGQEVATLVNDNLQPGSYQATFDASSMPSGVYVYQLKAGSYSESRKMLLMK